MYKLMKKGREEKTKFSKLLPNNQIIIACRIELRVQEMTMNEKLTMIGLTKILSNWYLAGQQLNLGCC